MVHLCSKICSKTQCYNCIKIYTINNWDIILSLLFVIYISCFIILFMHRYHFLCCRKHVRCVVSAVSSPLESSFRHCLQNGLSLTNINCLYFPIISLNACCSFLFIKILCVILSFFALSSNLISGIIILFVFHSSVNQQFSKSFNIIISNKFTDLSFGGFVLL